MRTPPLLDDFIHPRNCKPICEKLLTLPYTWSEQAREVKKKCDQNVITLEEYVEWLKHS